MKRLDMDRIILEIGKDSAPEAEQLLSSIGIHSYVIQVARSVVGKENTGLTSVFKPVVYEEDPVSIFSFSVPVEHSAWVAAYLVSKLNLTTPGQGSILVEPVNNAFSDEAEELVPLVKPEGIDESRSLLLDGVSQIVSIVQRGEGTNISMAALNLGQSVPSLTFGIGMGLREKLSLIRITFPRDKELLRIITNADEVQEVFNQLVDAGKLDQPGKGFIYISPIRTALPNTLLFRGTQRHAATMEQIIQAIDTANHSTTWRRKRVAEQLQSGPVRKYLKEMTELTVIAPDGMSQRFTLAAMSAGAGGATISKARNVRFANNERSSTGIEVMYIIVMAKAADSVLAALENAGLFSSEVQGSISARTVTEACTYLG